MCVKRLLARTISLLSARRPLPDRGRAPASIIGYAKYIAVFELKPLIPLTMERTRITSFPGLGWLAGRSFACRLCAVGSIHCRYFLKVEWNSMESCMAPPPPSPHRAHLTAATNAQLCSLYPHGTASMCTARCAPYKVRGSPIVVSMLSPSSPVYYARWLLLFIKNRNFYCVPRSVCVCECVYICVFVYNIRLFALFISSFPLNSSIVRVHCLWYVHATILIFLRHCVATPAQSPA